MVDMENKYTAYICFSRKNREDIEFAERIASEIRNCYPSAMQIHHMKGMDLERTPFDRDALSNACYLIVVCSVDSANDIEVHKEVERFLYSQRGDVTNIISLIINGTPCATKEGENECLPASLRDRYLYDHFISFNLSGFRQSYEDYIYRTMNTKLERELDTIKAQLVGAENDIRRMRYDNQEKEEYIRHLENGGMNKESYELEERQRQIEKDRLFLDRERERIAREKEELRKEREELDKERAYTHFQDPGVTYNPRCSTYSQFNLLDRFSKKGGKTVYASVFAPSEVKRDSHMLVQFYLHLAKETEIVKEMAVESQSTAQRRDYSPLQCKLFKGDRIKITLSVCNYNLLMEESKEIIWMGSFTKCSFDFLVPHKISTDEICCSAIISIGNYPVGEMKFITKIVPVPRKLNTNVLVKRFKKVFISYSHADFDNVQFVAKAYKALGIKYFFDSDNLEGGDVFEEEIMKNIDSSDLFILCWSANAAESEFIPKEIDRALIRAYPQKSHEEATIKIFPISIEPHTTLPDVMANKYHFEILG